MCISNHVSSLDPAAYISLGFQSFISKEEVKHIPCIGATCWANQGLFVKREDKESSAALQAEMKRRISDDIQDIGLPRKYPALVVFPESMTENQMALLPFKRGAFVPGRPVSMCCIRYDGRFFDHSNSSKRLWKVMLQCLVGLYSSVEVEYFGDYVPNEEEIEDHQMFSNNVREFYSKKMGIL